MPRITALIPSPRNPLVVSVRVDGRAVAKLSRDAVEELGLRVDQPWDDTLAARLGTASSFDKAFKLARNRLDRRPMSAVQLRRKLRDKGFDDAVLDRVIEKLTRIGMLDEAAYARAVIHDVQARKPAGARLLRVKLAQKGIERKVIDRIVPEETADQDPAADALNLAQRKLRTLSRYDTATKKRRLWGMLARRGFDSDAIRHALDRLPELRSDDAGTDPLDI